MRLKMRSGPVTRPSAGAYVELFLARLLRMGERSKAALRVIAARARAAGMRAIAARDNPTAARTCPQMGIDVRNKAA